MIEVLSFAAVLPVPGRLRSSQFYQRQERILAAAVLILAFLLPSVSIAQVNVTTFHNDPQRTGQNLAETNLTPANVNTNTFGKLFICPVDGQLYAQPLYMAGITITNQGVHNVVFAATEHDSVYAFDADSNSGSNAAPLWKVSFINPTAGVTTVPSADVNSGNVSPEIGITSTPVIDPATMTLYVEAKTKEVSGTTTSYVHRLHALDLGSGLEKFGGPVVVHPVVNGSGDGNDGAGHVPFNGLRQMNRPALLLANGIVYLAYGSHGDNGPYHGWVLGYNAQTLQPQGVFNTTPNGGLGGLWQGGDGPAADAAGNIYIITGNGAYDGTSKNDFGDSYLRLAQSGTNLSVADYFTPYNQQTLANDDTDLGSGGLILLPDSVGSATHPHLAVGCGKDGILRLVDRDNMGHFNSVNNNQLVQSFTGITGSYGTPAYFNNAIYYAGQGDVLKAFTFSNGVMQTAPTSSSGASFPFPGATPSISANGTSNGIVWAIQESASAVLRAFAATNVSRELYNSAQAGSRDSIGAPAKFAAPTVANGKVYVPAASALVIFGNGFWNAPPIITPVGGIFTNAITVTLSDAAGGKIYYTLDGTVPTTNSPQYAGPITLTNSTTLQAVAISGGVGSTVATAFFTAASQSTSLAGFGGNGSGWTLNGGAVVSNNVLTVTDGLGSEARSAFYNVAQPITAFTAQFLYQSSGGADGTAFVLQNASAGPSAVGSGGGCLGYCTITPSVAVEFNLYSGQGGTGTRFSTNGATGNYASTLPLDLGSGDSIWVSLSYDGANLVEALTDLQTGQTYNAVYSANLPALVGANTAFMGFTGGTGGAVSVQTISDFVLTTPSTLSLTPVIAPNGAIFTNSVSVSLSVPTNGAQIFYTLNGSAPTTNAFLYTHPFTLTNTAAVKAVAIAPGLAASGVSYAFFGEVSIAATLSGFGGTGIGWSKSGATITNNVLTLTDGKVNEAHSAFNQSSQIITNFIARFIYQSTGGANGAAFVVQNSGPSAVGTDAACLGYCGIIPSAAVEFNLYSGAGGSGTGFATNGTTGAYSSTLPLNFDSGDPIWVVLSYDGSTLTDHLVDQDTGATFDAAYPADLFDAVGGSASAFVGFTGGTGTAASTQTITGFTFGPNGASPLLTAAMSGNQLTIYWPASPLNYLLEFTTNLASPVNWAVLPVNPALSNGQASVTLPVGPTNTFYRLRIP